MFDKLGSILGKGFGKPQNPFTNQGKSALFGLGLGLIGAPKSQIGQRAVGGLLSGLAGHELSKDSGTPAIDRSKLMTQEDSPYWTPDMLYNRGYNENTQFFNPYDYGVDVQNNRFSNINNPAGDLFGYGMNSMPGHLGRYLG